VLAEADHDLSSTLTTESELSAHASHISLTYNHFSHIASSESLSVISETQVVIRPTLEWAAFRR
jgi:hypothetical protein